MAGNSFWQIGGFENNPPKLYSVMSSLPHGFHMYNRPAAGRTSIIVSIEFTIDSCVRGHHVSKELWKPKVEELTCQREEGNLNYVCVVIVKTDTGIVVGHLPRKISSLLSVSASEWYNQLKLAHSLVQLPAHSISHFAMNIIMAKTFSTAKVNSAKCHNFSNPPKYLPAQISGHTVCSYIAIRSYMVP